MNQTELLVLMTELADDEAAPAPDVALSFLAGHLERMCPAMDSTDYEGLLYTGAAIWKLLRERRFPIGIV